MVESSIKLLSTTFCVPFVLKWKAKFNSLRSYKVIMLKNTFFRPFNSYNGSKQDYFSIFLLQLPSPTPNRIALQKETAICWNLGEIGCFKWSKKLYALDAPHSIFFFFPSLSGYRPQVGSYIPKMCT